FPSGTRVWDLPTGERVRDLSAVPTSYVLSLTPDGERLLAYSQRGVVESWGVESNRSTVLWKRAVQPDNARDPFMPVALPRGDEFVALWGYPANRIGPVYWYTAGRQIRFGVVPHSPGPLTVSPDGKWVVAAEETTFCPARVYLWKLPD